MDKQAYLDQISQSVRPEKQSPFSSISPVIKYGLLGAIVLIILLFFLSALGSQGDKLQESAFALKIHVDNVETEIDTYHSSLKSSVLRSYSTSLKTILLNMSPALNSYVTNQYEYSDKTIPDSVTTDEETLLTTLDESLFKAKINGYLDSTYASEMAYEISIITARIETVFDDIDDESLRATIQSSYDSLNLLYDNFANFSPAKTSNSLSN